MSTAQNGTVEIVKNMGLCCMGRSHSGFGFCSEDADQDCCYYQGRLSLNGIKNSNRGKQVQLWKMCFTAQSGVRQTNQLWLEILDVAEHKEKACVTFA